MAGPPTPSCTRHLNVLFLLSQNGSQANFFADAASVLLAEGYVVVECFVPRPGTRLVDGENPAYFPIGRHIEVRTVTPDSVCLLVSQNDQAEQVWQFNEIILRSDSTIQMVPSTIAYLTPEQIDAMATSVGFELIGRYSDWEGSVYTQSAQKHITVYKMAQTEVLDARTLPNT